MKLNEAGITLIDCDHKTPAAQASGYPYVGIPQLKDGHIRLDGARLISEEDFVLWTKKAKPQLNDVILSRRCNPGESAYVPESLEIALGQNLVLLRSDGSVIYPPFLRWLVQGNEWWEQVNKFLNVGAVFNSLKCKDIPNFKLTIPSLKEQREITDILSSLDKKIELNSKLNQTLESIAQAIFKSWFIDFEPVRAKIAAKQEGSDPELAAMCAISGKSEAELDQLTKEDFAELQATAALFPDELVESELGEVPRGWEVSNFKGFCKKIESGGTPKRSELHYWNGEIRWLSSGEVRETVVFDTKEKITKTGLLNSSAKLWEKYTTVIAMYGATAGQVCLLANEMAANQACCGLIPKDEFKSFAFLIARNSVRSLSDKASGSAQQNLNKGIIENQPCVLPRLSVARNFENLVFPLLRKWLANSEENIRLSVIRDSLLPKLLSGELDVSDLQSAGD